MKTAAAIWVLLPWIGLGLATLTAPLVGVEMYHLRVMVAIVFFGLWSPTWLLFFLFLRKAFET